MNVLKVGQYYQYKDSKILESISPSPFLMVRVG